MFQRDTQLLGGFETLQQAAQIRLRVECERSPAGVEELVGVMTARGHAVEVVEMKPAGVRPFGVIGRLRVDGFECIAKLAGEHLPEDHPDWGEAFIRQSAIEQEYEGLKGATGLTPRLIGEIVVGEQTVGVLREFMGGSSLGDAIRQGLISPEEALRKAIELDRAVNGRGFKLWDPEPGNLWLTPQGEVIFLEGQCLVRQSEQDRAKLETDGVKRLVEIMLGEPSAS